MTIIVCGGHGQLGRALSGRPDIVCLGRGELDVTSPADLDAALDAFLPDAVINAAAFTAVDRAETGDRAWRINADGAAHVAAACADRGVPLLHVSTDHVFDGRASTPYREDDPVAPINAYGRSKAAGERAVLAAGGTVVRTSWLFGSLTSGFVPAIVAQARAGRPLRVVADQHGCPTGADELAAILPRLISIPGIVHACGGGATTWHGLAVAIVDELVALGHPRVAVEAIPSSAWPGAPRPAYAVLDTGRLTALGLALPSWRASLAGTVLRLVQA